MTGEYELAIIPGKIDLRSVSAYARMHSGATHPFSMYVDIITLNITHEFLRGTAFDKRDACTSLVRAYEYVQDGAASYDIDYVLVGCPVREISTVLRVLAAERNGRLCPIPKDTDYPPD